MSASVPLSFSMKFCLQDASGQLDRYIVVMQTESHQIVTEIQPAAVASSPVVRSDENSPSTGNLTYQPMVLVFLAVLVGILFDFCFSLSFWWMFGLAVVAVSLVFGFLLIDGRSRHTRAFRSLILLLAIATISAAWHHGYWNWYGANEIGVFTSRQPQPCCIEMTLRSEPRIVNIGDQPSRTEAAFETRFSARVTRLRDGTQWRTATGNCELVVHGDAKHLKSGDSVCVFGKLTGISPPTNPGQFDFYRYFRGKRVLAFVHVYQADAIQKVGHANTESRWLSTVRRRLNQVIWEHVDESQAAFAAAVLLGNRSQLTKSKRDIYLQTGTIHLLAISGLHVGILACGFLALSRLGFLSRRTCLWLTILFVVFYAWLVEFRPPALRATILVVLICAGRLLGQKAFSMNLLAAAAVMILMLNPCDLFGVGPQLSFLAVATLAVGARWIYLRPSDDPLDRLIARTRPDWVRRVNWLGRQMRTAILVSVAIWLVALPLVAHHFHVVSLAGLVLNPLLMIPVAIGLYAGAGVLLIGTWFSIAGRLLGMLCCLGFATTNALVLSLHSYSWSHCWTAGPPLWSVVVFYIGFVGFVLVPTTRLSLRWLVLLYLGWFCLGWCLPGYLGTKAESLQCTFVDVGHGTCVIIRPSNGETWLYDAGALNNAEFGAGNISNCLWEDGVDHLAGVVLSHADVDHFNALPILLDKFSIGTVYVSNAMAKSNAEQVIELFRGIEKHGVRVVKLTAGDELKLSDQSRLQVLSPGSELPVGNDNSNSLVVRVEAKGRSILLPGDLEGPGMEALLQKEAIDTDVMMAPHHGSIHSRPLEFVRWSNPEHVVISCGSQKLSRPALESLAQDPGILVHRTDRDGAIRVTIGPHDISLTASPVVVGFEFNNGGSQFAVDLISILNREFSIHYDVDTKAKKKQSCRQDNRDVYPDRPSLTENHSIFFFRAGRWWKKPPHRGDADFLKVITNRELVDD